jgi:ligand-binding SRPBCC domain-containing protein
MAFAKGALMPVFEDTIDLPRPVAEVFAFFNDPRNLERISPPDLHLRVIEGPERLFRGARIVVAGRRWGIPQRIVSEVPGQSFTDTQVQGPFLRWVRTHRFEEVAGGTRVSDHIDYEPPGGVLGLVITPAFVEQDLRRAYAYRATKLRELFGAAG